MALNLDALRKASIYSDKPRIFLRDGYWCVTNLPIATVPASAVLLRWAMASRFVRSRNIAITIARDKAAHPELYGFAEEPPSLRTWFL